MSAANAVLELDYLPEIPTEELEVVYSRDMNKQQEIELFALLATIKSTLNWHWGSIAGACVVALFLFGVVFTRIGFFSDTRTAQADSLANEVASLTARVTTTGSKPGPVVLGALKDAVDSADRPLGFKKIAAISDAARRKQIPVPESDLRAIGQKLVRSAPNPNQIQWDAALKLASYTSILVDPSLSAQGKVPVPSGATHTFDTIRQPGRPAWTVTGWGHVPVEQGRQAAPISAFFALQEERKKANSVVVEWSEVDAHGDRIPLDNWHIRKAIIKNAVVVYDSGPVILENVYFVNCTFLMKSGSPARELLTTFSPARM